MVQTLWECSDLSELWPARPVSLHNFEIVPISLGYQSFAVRLSKT